MADKGNRSKRTFITFYSRCVILVRMSWSDQSPLDKKGKLKKKDKGEGAVSKWTRRGFLTFLGAGTAATAGNVYSIFDGQESERREESREEEVGTEVQETREYPVGEFPLSLQFPDLGTHEDNAGDIYALYLGLPAGDPIPEHVLVDGFAVLENAYDNKEAYIRDHYSGGEQEQYLRNAREARNHARRLLTERSRTPVRFSSIGEFAESISTLPSEMHGAVDWDKLAREMGLDAREQSLLELVARKIDAHMLLAYTMTELFPAQTGLSLNIFEQYLQAGGIHVFEVMPAMYDRYISHGMGQFTSLALQELPGDVRGASVVNQCLKPRSDERISGSVLLVDEYKEQFRAMWMFGVYNLARLVRQLDADEMHTLQENSDDPEFGVELTQFLASQHHAPADNAFEEYIEHDMIGSHKRHARPRIRPYIQEAHDYYRALESELRHS